MRRSMMILTILSIIILSAISLFSQENWTQWRGPDQNGVSSAKNLPANWSSDKNIIWKTALPSWSAATPIIWGDRIFITSPSAPEPKAKEPETEQPTQGQRRRRRSMDPGGSKLYLMCISKTDGTILWKQELDNKNTTYRKHNNVSPSAVTDGKYVWIVTGTGVVKAFDMDGKEIWGNNLEEKYGKFGLNWGYASSPLLYKDQLIIEVLHGNNTDDPSYIVSFNADDGKVNWRVERPTDAERESPDAYTTPVLLQQQGFTQIVISGGDYVTGHDPDTGQELWRAGGLNPLKRANYRVVGTPIIEGDIMIVPTRKKPLQAFMLARSGKVSDSDLLWRYEGGGAPDVPSPVSDGKYLYLVDDKGMITCLNLKTGETIWGPERTAAGIVSTSPLLAGGRIYILNEKGVTSVVAAGSAFKVLSTNELDGSYTLSSPAVSGSRIYIRTAEYLYCIGE